MYRRTYRSSRLRLDVPPGSVEELVVSSATIETLLKEGERYPPSEAFRQRAAVRDGGLYAAAQKDPEGFWAEEARNLEWSTPWTRVLEWKLPFAGWCVGGRLNVSVNCLDRHVATARRNKAALIWEGEPGDHRVLTYHQLWREVNRFANVLKGLGVKRGARVTIYIPVAPDPPTPMRPGPRRGAIHGVFWGGFSAKNHAVDRP